MSGSHRSWAVVPSWTGGNDGSFPKYRGLYWHADFDPLSKAHLYKYVSAETAYAILRSGKLRFNAPHTWPDPHEKWWCDQLFPEGSALRGAYPFGLCWTKRSEDEPFWRMYACTCIEQDHVDGTRRLIKPMPSVRFRARTNVLFEWLRGAVQAQHGKGFMGVVRYCPRPQLIDAAAQVARSHALDQVASLAATALHMKRKAFRFELETRMLWIDRAGKRDFHEVALDPVRIFDQVMIGPAKTTAAYNEVAEALLKLGVPPRLIRQSSIGKPPVVLTQSVSVDSARSR